MKYINKDIYKELKIDYEKCFGFCCIALYFSKTYRFPEDKEPGKPCINLQSDFKCKVHRDLRKKGLKGCTAYDCFGAGQKVAQVTYEGHDWREGPEYSNKMYDVFIVMRQLHEMLWYLAEAYRLQKDEKIKEEISKMIDETENLTKLDKDSIIKIDLVRHRFRVNKLLLNTSKGIRNKLNKKSKNRLRNRKIISVRLNLIGADLKKVNLVGEDLSGALLIASDLRGVNLSGTDLIGVDLRDADLRGANLRESIFITQAQINSAKGDISTVLPVSIVRPSHWIE